MDQCGEVIDGIDEASLINQRAWRKDTLMNRKSLICRSCREFLGQNFTAMIELKKLKCFYHKTDSTGPKYRKKVSDMRTLNYEWGSKMLDLKNEDKTFYCPKDLSVCYHCHKDISNLVAEDQKVDKENKSPNRKGVKDGSNPMDIDDVRELDDVISHRTVSTEPDPDYELEPDHDTDQNSEINIGPEILPNTIALNTLLLESSMRVRVEQMLEIKFEDASPQTQKKLLDIVRKSIVAVLRAITPDAENQNILFQMVCESDELQNMIDGKIYMPRDVKEMILYYNFTKDPKEKLKCIAILSKRYGFAFLDNFNPPEVRKKRKHPKEVVSEFDDFGNEIYFKKPLTEWKFNKAQKHRLLNGHGLAPVPTKQRHVNRVKNEVLESIYAFVTSNEVTKQVAFGTYRIKKSDGSKKTIAAMIRNYSNSELARRVIAYLKSLHFQENDIPSERFIRDLLSVMKAKKSKQMRGISLAIDNGKCIIIMLILTFCAELIDFLLM